LATLSGDFSRFFVARPAQSLALTSIARVQQKLGSSRPDRAAAVVQAPLPLGQQAGLDTHLRIKVKLSTRKRDIGGCVPYVAALKGEVVDFNRALRGLRDQSDRVQILDPPPIL
jgi:hypothetical protein